VNGVSNLHSVWDSVIYQFPGYPVMPLSNSDWDWYSTQTETMSTDYPVNSADVLPEDYSTWA
jgi:hypothetical protein